MIRGIDRYRDVKTDSAVLCLKDGDRIGTAKSLFCFSIWKFHLLLFLGKKVGGVVYRVPLFFWRVLPRNKPRVTASVKKLRTERTRVEIAVLSVIFLFLFFLIVVVGAVALYFRGFCYFIIINIVEEKKKIFFERS